MKQVKTWQTVSKIFKDSEDGSSNNVAALMEAMFVAAARVLGLQFNDPLPIEAQHRILAAAINLTDELRDYLTKSPNGLMSLKLRN